MTSRTSSEMELPGGSQLPHTTYVARNLTIHYIREVAEMPAPLPFREMTPRNAALGGMFCRGRFSPSSEGLRIETNQPDSRPRPRWALQPLFGGAAD